MCVVFFCQAEDGIRDLVRSRGLGDVYKRQAVAKQFLNRADVLAVFQQVGGEAMPQGVRGDVLGLSLIHI